MSGNAGCTVYVGNLDERVSDRVLYDILIQAGRVVDLYVPRDKETDRPKGYAFAEYETEEIADYAVRLFSGLVTLYKRTLKFAISGKDKPSPNLQTATVPALNSAFKVPPPVLLNSTEVSPHSARFSTPRRFSELQTNNAQGFLCRSARTMGCFFGCFRIRGDNQRTTQNRLVSEPAPFKAREPVISPNALSSFLLAEEKEHPEPGTPQHVKDDEQLKDEARFLKACGTLGETPVEFRKAPGKTKDLTHCDRDLEHQKFHSWLPNISIEKLNLEKQPDQPPTPIKLCEEWVKESDSLEHTPSSCISYGGNAGGISGSSIQGSGIGSVANWSSSTTTSSLTNTDMAANVQPITKSVRFECEDGVDVFPTGNSVSGTADQNVSKQPESAGQYSVSKPSPYPTPLKLTDEMQTPGTMFPYRENMGNAKNPRIRSQYVYSALNPVENSPQWKELKEEEFSTFTTSGHLRESIDQADTMTPETDVRTTGASVEKELKVEASLSSWLKPPSTNQASSSHQSGNNSVGKAHLGRTPVDRPIIGMVAAHWNEEEPTRISPKYWDGNGIPNSTNKYKEDQTVSWHATPFEERLEKALSDETSIPQRKNLIGKTLIGFDEAEESDTALSQLQSSTQSKPVVSF